MTQARTIIKPGNTGNTRLLHLPAPHSSISLKQSISSVFPGTKMQANYMLSDNPLSLDRIRSILTRLEDTIIFSLIERAQFAHNPKIYQRGAFPDISDLGPKSLFEWFLKETESFHGKLVISIISDCLIPSTFIPCLFPASTQPPRVVSAHLMPRC